LRFGGVLVLACVFGGFGVVLHNAVAVRVEAGAAGFGIKIVVDCG
jgi:hypothetical protein